MIAMAEYVRGRALPHLKAWRMRKLMAQSELAAALQAEVKRLSAQARRLTAKQVRTVDERDKALAEVERLRDLVRSVAQLEVVFRHSGHETYLRSDSVDVLRLVAQARQLVALD